MKERGCNLMDNDVYKQEKGNPKKDVKERPFIKLKVRGEGISNIVYKKIVEPKKILNEMIFTFKISEDNLKILKEENIRFNDKEYAKIWVMILQYILPLLLDFNERLEKLYESK